MLVVSVLSAAVLGPLTALGARRRGASPPVVVLSGLFFPLAWAVWYVQDELPLRRTS